MPTPLVGRRGAARYLSLAADHGPDRASDLHQEAKPLTTSAASLANAATCSVPSCH